MGPLSLGVRMLERDRSGQYWVSCPKMQVDSDIPIKVMLGSCLECDHNCSNKEHLWDLLILKEVELSDPRLSMDRYEKSKTGNQKFCIQRAHLFKECYARRRFCIFNEICPSKPYGGNVKLLRQRRVAMYAIVNKSNELIMVDAKDLKSFPLDQIKDAYQISHAIRITTELIPYNDEGKELEDTVKSFVAKHGSNIITAEGKSVNLKQWFNTSEVNSLAFVVTDRLKAAKKIDIISLKKFLDDSPESVTSFEPEVETKPAKVEAPKRIRRSKEQLAAEKVIVEKIRNNVPEPAKVVPVKEKRKRRTRAEMTALRIMQDKEQNARRR